MEISAVGVSKLIARSMPTNLIEFGEVGLVLGVKDVNRGAPADDDVGHEVTQCPQSWSRPMNWHGSLSQSPNSHFASRLGGFSPDHRLDVSLPQLLKWNTPRESVQLPPASKSALVDNPTERLHSVTCLSAEAWVKADATPQIARVRPRGGHISEAQ
jgi:hypothetical protein